MKAVFSKVHFWSQHCILQSVLRLEILVYSIVLYTIGFTKIFSVQRQRAFFKYLLGKKIKGGQIIKKSKKNPKFSKIIILEVDIFFFKKSSLSLHNICFCESLDVSYVQICLLISEIHALQNIPTLGQFGSHFVFQDGRQGKFA